MKDRGFRASDGGYTPPLFNADGPDGVDPSRYGICQACGQLTDNPFSEQLCEPCADKLDHHGD